MNGIVLLATMKEEGIFKAKDEEKSEFADKVKTQDRQTDRRRVTPLVSVKMAWRQTTASLLSDLDFSIHAVVYGQYVSTHCLSMCLRLCL